MAFYVLSLSVFYIMKHLSCPLNIKIVLFVAKTKDGSRHHVFDSVQYFLANIAMADIEAVAELLSKKASTEFFTPKEKDDFNRFV